LAPDAQSAFDGLHAIRKAAKAGAGIRVGAGDAVVMNVNDGAVAPTAQHRWPPSV
jgi:hypothetical protein